MRKMQSIVGELIAALEEFTDPNRVEKSKTYFPTAQRVLGFKGAFKTGQAVGDRVSEKV